MKIKPYIPYSGCKQRISEKIVNLIKTKKHCEDTIIDLFGGGGSMSFEFLQQNFKRVIYNEYNKGYYALVLFFKKRRQFCLQNNLKLSLPDYFYNFIDKDKYIELKMQDNNLLNEEQLAYKYFVIACYTFNNLQDSTNKTHGYLYGQNKRDMNGVVHQAIVFKDKASLQQLKNYFSILGNITDLFDCCLQNDLQKAIYDFKRYIDIVTCLFEVINKYPKMSPLIIRIQENLKADINYFDNKLSQKKLCKILLFNGIKQTKPGRLSCSNFISNGCFSCDHLQRLLHIETILKLPLERLEVYNCDYANFDFNKYNNFIVYCDPPYFNTNGYEKVSFDFSKFSSFCYNFKHPLFVSEITNPQPNKLVSIMAHNIKDNVSASTLRKEQLFYNNQ